MLSYMIGDVAEITATGIVLDHNGIGYEITLSAGDINRIHLNTEVKIYTHLQLRENEVSLFGFLSREDLTLFRLLIGVNGIGPKGAVAILSVLSADDLRFAIAAEDDKTIAKAPGIGKKTAQRVIIDLKDKIDFVDAVTTKAENGIAENTAGGSDERTEAILALNALGYSSAEALRAIHDLDTTDMTVEQIIKEGLKRLI